MNENTNKLLGLSEKGKQLLSSCHPDLIRVFTTVSISFPIQILEGHRSEERQLEMFNQGLSKIKQGGTHCSIPSRAVDVAPLPIDWSDTKKYFYFAGFVIATATYLDVKLRWGGDWDSDLDFKDQTFNDLGHFELA